MSLELDSLNLLFRVIYSSSFFYTEVFNSCFLAHFSLQFSFFSSFFKLSLIIGFGYSISLSLFSISSFLIDVYSFYASLSSDFSIYFIYLLSSEVYSPFYNSLSSVCFLLLWYLSFTTLELLNLSNSSAGIFDFVIFLSYFLTASTVFSSVSESSYEF